jgi:K+-transporting ATPase ATPase A chain
MDKSGWIQLLVFVIALVAITKPMGIYLLRVLDPEKEGGMGILETILSPLERFIYWVARVDRKKQQNWKQYAIAVLIFSMLTTLLSYGLFRMQDILPLKANIANLAATVDKTGAIGAPVLDANNHLISGGKVSPIIAFIQAVSFQTNTDWQSYTPEQTLTYFSQTVATAVQFFFSAAIGIAVAAVLVRGVSRKQTHDIGNFLVDLTRITLYLFLPICSVYALILAWQGTPMNFRAYTHASQVDQSTAASTTQPVIQQIVQGPMASYCAPKVLGLNGPGFTGADCAHPFENPTPLSQFLQLILFFSIIAGLPYYYGRMINNRLHAWNIWGVMFILLITGILFTWYFESRPNPRLTELGIAPASANMEGKETRIGIYNSAAWANDVTATAEGANNCAHDSLTPMAGFMLMFNMHMGEVVFGGIGSGLYGMLIFTFIAVFLAGLMIGKTPEYLGKRIEGYDVKLASLFIFPTLIVSLGLTAWACADPSWGSKFNTNSGPHGFSEIFYAYSSGVANNGTAFGGMGYTPLTPDGTHYATTTFNVTQTFCMLLGRYFQIIPALALAGALAKKRPAPANVGSFPVVGPTFMLLIIGVIVIVGALNFLPGLALGPIVEHYLMTGSKALF